MKTDYTENRVAARLTTALQQRKMTQSELAEKTGINFSTISSYASGRFEPKRTPLMKMAEALNVSPTWLAGFDVPMEREGARISSFSDISITIPFISQKLSAGTGENYLSADDIETKTINISEYFARGVDKASLLAAEVRGDSMIEEKIFPGDIVIFSRGLIRQEGIYVINYAGDVMVKKLLFDALANTVDIISGNRAYPTRTVEAENIAILGKVVGWIHKVEF